MKGVQGVLDIFVNKLVQKSGKILLRDDLERLWVLSGGSIPRLAYAIGQMKHQGHVSRLMSDLFFVWSPPDNPDDLYWEMIRVLIKHYSPSGAIIAGEKSMEYHLRNFSIPDVLVLYTRDTSKRIKLSNEREVHFRVLKSGEKKWSKNMFRLLDKHAVKWMIDGREIDFLGPEASLLDAAALHFHETGLSELLFEQFLRQYEKRLSRESLWELVSYRYIRAANRLRAFARDRGFALLYGYMLDVIKKEGGGCFLNI